MLEGEGVVSTCVIFAALFVYIVSFYYAGENCILIMAHMIVPTLDHLTDMFYVLTVTFFYPWLFAVCFISLFGSTLCFMYDLFITTNTYPSLEWPYMQKDIFVLSEENGHPMWKSEHVLPHFDQHENPCKGLWYVSSWILHGIAQLLLIVVAVFVNGCYFPVLLPLWILWGGFLYQTKAMSVGKVRLMWYNVWKDMFSTVPLDINRCVPMRTSV